MAEDDNRSPPHPQKPPEFTSPLLETRAALHARRMEEIDIMGEGAAQAAWQRSCKAYDAYVEWVNKDWNEMRAREANREAIHRPTPSPSPPAGRDLQPAPQAEDEIEFEHTPPPSAEDTDQNPPSPSRMMPVVVPKAIPDPLPPHLEYDYLEEGHEWPEQIKQGVKRMFEEEDEDEFPDILSRSPSPLHMESHKDEAREQEVLQRIESGKRTLSEFHEEGDHE